MNLSTSVWSTPGKHRWEGWRAVRSGLERLARWGPTNGWPAATEAGCSSAGRGILMSSGWRCLGPEPLDVLVRGSDGHRERFMITGICYGCAPVSAAWSVGVLLVGGGFSRAGRTPPAPFRSGTLVVPRPRRWHHSANRKCLDVDAAKDAQGVLRPSRRPTGMSRQDHRFMSKHAAPDQVEFRLNGVAVAAVPVGTVIRATGEAGQATVTARVTMTARADGISDTVL
jgi:hypothetical protein